MATPAPGSIILCHGHGFIGWLIRFGQWIHHPLRTAYWEWDHIAIVSDETVNGDPKVIQAVASGVTDTATLSTIAPGGKYQIVSLPQGVDPTKVLQFAKSKVGVPYGFVADTSIGIGMLTPAFIKFDFQRDGTLICSALGALSLLAGGWTYPVSDYYSITPAMVAQALGANGSAEAWAAFSGRKITL